MTELTPNASVLLGFRAANVRSFRDPFGFSMMATRFAEKSVVRHVAWRNEGQPIGVLPAAAFFGANALFLSTAASANHPTLLPLYDWFDRNLLLASENNRIARQAATAVMLEHVPGRTQILDFIRAGDLGITGAKRKEYPDGLKDAV